MSGLPRDINELWRPFQQYLQSQLPNADLFIYSGEDAKGFHELQPARLLVEPQVRHIALETKIKRFYHAPTNTNPYCQQVYGMKRAWELQQQYAEEHGITYDLIVRTRPDLLWLQPVTTDMLDITKISTLHLPSVLLPCEFAIGPNAEMTQYMHIYDWLLAHGDEYNDKHWILTHKPDRGYCSDSYMTIYLQEVLKFELGLPKTTDPHYWPYNFYRVMAIHRRGDYDRCEVADPRFNYVA